MTHGSLFSGIGGFDLAAQWMGWENVFHCEFNPFGRRVLKHWWPDAISYEDVTKTDFTSHSGQIDILTGGFPCQPYSTAGKQKGKEDERHLWPEMLRVISEIRPRYVVGENVRGLISWNGGLVFDEVQADLEAQGYEVLPFLLPAAGVGAPHERYRIWFVAFNSEYVTNGANNGRACKGKGMDLERNELVQTRRQQGSNNAEPPNSHVAYAYQVRSKGRQKPRSIKSIGQTANEQFTGLFEPPSWEEFPTQPPICGGNDGLSRELDGITFSKWKNESIAAFGNAIVPQVALQIFKALPL